MTGKKRSKKGKYFFLLYFSFIIFTLLPVIVIGSYAVRQFQVRLNIEFEQNNNTILNYIKESIDSQILQLEMNLLVIQSDRNFKFLLNRVDRFSDVAYAQFQLQTLLSSMTASNDLLNSLEIHFLQNSRILSDSTTSNYTKYYNRVIFDKASGEGFDKGLHTIPDPVDRKVLTEVYTMIRKNPSFAVEHKALIAINIDIQSLEETLTKLKSNENMNLQIIDENDSVIASSAGSAIELTTGESRIWTLDSDLYSWKYRILIPEAYFSRQINSGRRLIVILCIIMVLIDGFLAYLLSNRLYSPIHKIIMSVKEKTSRTGPSTENEFTFLHEAFSDFISSNEKLNKFLRDERDPISFSILRRLLETGPESHSSLKNHLNFLGIHTDYTTFSVIALESHETRAIAIPLVARYAIIDIARTIAEKTNFAILPATVQANRLHFLLMSNSSPESHMDRVSDLCGKIIKAVEDQVQFKAIASIGNSEKKLNLVSISFKNANAALDQKFFRVPYDRILSNIELKPAGSDIILSQKTINRIVDLSIANEKADLEQEIESAFRYFRQNSLSELSVRMTVSFILLSLATQLEKKSKNLNDILQVEEGYISSLNSFATISSLRDWLMASLSAVGEHLQESSLDFSAPVQAAIDFINANYASSISLTDISGYLHMSSQYLSKIFKEETGFNYINYINDLRLEKAMQLISDTELSVKEIASLTGFSNSQYFIKRFKDKYRITPTQKR